MAKKEIPTYEFSKIQRMMPESLDKLPWPAEAKGHRLNWVGIGIVNEGPAQGDETMKIIDTENDE